MHDMNRDVARHLRLLGELLEISGKEPYKIRAYYRAADTISRLASPVDDMDEARLTDLPGIGENIARKVIEYVKTGAIHELTELEESVPSGLVGMLDLDGVGPKTIHALWTKMGIEDIAMLEKAAKNRRLRALHGFGPKKEEAIIQAVAGYRRKTSRMTRKEAEELIGRIEPAFPGKNFTVAGSFRRGRSTIGDIDIVSTEAPARTNALLQEVADEIIDQGERKTSFSIGDRRVDVRFCTPAFAGTMLLYLTGSKQFNIKMREIALSRGEKLNEYGIEDREEGRTYTFPDEASVFSFLGMDYIPPELREDQGEIEHARRHTLPELVRETDIRGDLHMHSSWSDGALSIAELARLGEERGYEYIACTDHSASLGVAHGLDAARLAKQHHEIEMSNRSHSCRILAGIEVDILGDGSLGLSGPVLADCDLVIASVHSGFKQDRDVMTRRILSAMENEHVDIIGHPTGRLLGKREAYLVDMERIISAAADTGTALEINASPYRLDLDDIYVREAHDHGVMLSIGTDAHTREEAAAIRFGVGIARRGWCGKQDILNTRPFKGFFT
ncbi:MAG: DNA polymerase/3'-5' exonuclease PolX [Methanomicrobiales archaeon]|nr:DNA polymerase/3'-5' exonuclease PolX [Methanomicrobiales archaeon]